MDQIRVPQRSYYAQMLHLYDDCLDVYEYRLIGHYLRVGNCWEGIKTTAKKTKMSVGKASQTRQKLADDGWIKMKPNSRDGYDIEVVDLMVYNVLHYSGELVLDLEAPPKTWSKAGVHDMKGGSPHETQGSSHETPYSPHETKKNQLRKTIEEETHTGDDALKAKAKSQQKHNVDASLMTYFGSMGLGTPPKEIFELAYVIHELSSNNHDTDQIAHTAFTLWGQDATPDLLKQFFEGKDCWFRKYGPGAKNRSGYAQCYTKNILGGYRDAVNWQRLQTNSSKTQPTSSVPISERQAVVVIH